MISTTVGGTIDSGTGVLRLAGNLTASGTMSWLTFYAALINGTLDLGTSARTFTVNDSFGIGDLVIDAPVTNSATSNLRIGVATQAAANADTTVRVRLNESF